MRIRFYILASTLFLLLAGGAAHAASLADKLQQKYAGISSMRAEFTQVLVHKESGSKEQRKGILSFKKPLLVRWETSTPSQELLLVGKDAIWNAFPEEEIAYKYALDLAQDSRSIIRVITGQSRIDQDFYMEDEGKENTLRRLRLYPKEAVQSMVEVLLWIDEKTDLIKKIRVYDFYGNENEIAFTRQDVGVALKDSLFSYSPPKGFEVEDMTKDTTAAPKNL